MKKPKIERGFKVLDFCNGGYFSAIVAMARGGREYVPYKWTRRGNTRIHGPLAVFKNLGDADRFAYNNCRDHSDDVCIMPCFYTPSYDRVFYYRDDRLRLRVPEGTRFADAVKIIDWD